jgi:hypothetical protein
MQRGAGYRLKLETSSKSLVFSMKTIVRCRENTSTVQRRKENSTNFYIEPSRLLGLGHEMKMPMKGIGARDRIQIFEKITTYRTK